MKKNHLKMSAFKNVMLSSKKTIAIKGGSGTLTVLDTDMEAAHGGGMEHDLEGFTKSKRPK